MLPKFRAWHKEYKQMYEVKKIVWYTEFEKDCYPNTPEAYIVLHGATPSSYLTPSLDDIVIMQSSGVKDKNGVETFEGDVLEYYSALVDKGENPYKRMVATWDKKTASFKNCFNGVIIGNVHQHPELMKE